ncbi:MAG: PfaD family polyunsaturated fatty acid/polyketide biosynthesis protein [Spirochaetota bacterium]
MNEMPHEYRVLYQFMNRLDSPFFIQKSGESVICRHDDSGTLDEVHIPAISPESLGSTSFKVRHDIQYAYAAGAMAGTIASEKLVVALARRGFLSFFGSGGASPARIEQAIQTLKRELPDKSYGFNLLNNPFEPKIEEETVDLYLKHNISRVSASAYIKLTPYVIRYRLTGLHRRDDGSVVAPNSVLAKLSRREVAEAFLNPPPEAVVQDLLRAGKVTAGEAELAREIPVADDIIAESDSGGHTDNRPFVSLIPQILSLRSEYADRYPGRNIHIGAAGGISTPQAIAAAFSMGADFVLTGSINQSCIESGTSRIVKELLVHAEVPDVRMAPAADMFESGAQVQVLKYGTMYAMRAEKLYNLYKTYSGMDEIPEKDRTFIEKTIFQATLDDVWEQTAAFFRERNPVILDGAMKDPKRKMALVFRWYLGKSSRWAFSGDELRKSDFQIWCGPSMGSFNQWARTTRFESAENRSAPDVAIELMRGAAYLSRLSVARAYGIDVPPAMWEYRPV